MKYILSVLCLVMIAACDKDTGPAHAFAGTWTLNNANENRGGRMVIHDCRNTTCVVDLDAWADIYTCELHAKITLTDATNAIHTEQQYVYNFEQQAVVPGPVGVTFELLAPDKMELDYLNADTVGEYCGLNATLTGVWTRQDKTTD